MTDAQRNIVVASLIIIGLVLPFVMLEWRTQYGTPTPTPVLRFYDTQLADQRVLRWGIYTRHGIPGILLGVIAPIGLFALAAFVTVGSKEPR